MRGRFHESLTQVLVRRPLTPTLSPRAGRGGAGAEFAAQEAHLALYCRANPRIFLASCGVATSRPRFRAIFTMRSTSTALFLASSPGAM